MTTTKPTSTFSCILDSILVDTHAHFSTCECTTSALFTCFCLEGRASLGVIVSWSYYAVHLWRSHYKIHQLFRHICPVFNHTLHKLVHHRHVLSPLSLCCIDKINKLLSIRKSSCSPLYGVSRQRKMLLCKCLT